MTGCAVVPDSIYGTATGDAVSAMETADAVGARETADAIGGFMFLRWSRQNQ